MCLQKLASDSSYAFLIIQSLSLLILTLSASSLLQENVDALINCVMKNIGFSHGKPVAAFTIYKCLLHWKSFEAEKTSVFDRLIQMIGSEIEVIGYHYSLNFSHPSWLSFQDVCSTSLTLRSFIKLHVLFYENQWAFRYMVIIYWNCTTFWYMKNNIKRGQAER